MTVEQNRSLNLTGALRRHARGANVAFIVPGGPDGVDRQISYRTLYAWVQAYATGGSALLNDEFSPGEYRFVAIRAGRSVETIALFLGLMAAGFCPCLLEPKATWPALAERMRAVGIRLLITDDEAASVALAHQPMRIYAPAALRMPVGEASDAPAA
ncbi:AMP-binding protein [Affinibrenneria salicis]|uniref:AMP-binding protein n=1 Tax=Affinibrenneria salicis TaxID=2590031 RepID=A0A5J5G3S1_9GAMM|nr:AMP-binding protein [Affinibrenneria salicis]KAA9001293.1 AMP-binding protein [Affinibrenneria salicis]